MAVIIEGQTPCAICGGELSTPYTALSGMAFMPDESLFMYCDAPLHFSCLEKWARREEFALGYYQLARRDHSRGNCFILAEQNNWMLACGSARPAPRPYFAEVRLRDWPVRLYTKFERWDEFLDRGFRSGVHGQALEAARIAIDEVREIAPDFEALCELLADRR